MKSHGSYKYGVVVWGLGNHSVKTVIPAIISSKEAFLKGVYSNSLDQSFKISNQFSCLSFKNENEFLTNEKINLVYIAGSNIDHEINTKKCLEFKKNVIVEKPALIKPTVLSKLINTCQKENIFLFEAYMYKFHELFHKFKEIIDDNKYGNVKKAIISFTIPHIDFNNFRYFSNSLGGALNDLGGYTINAAMSLFNQELKLEWSKINKPKNFSVDISGTAIFSSSSNFEVICNWGFGFPYKNEIEVWCENGVINSERFFSKPPDLNTFISINKNFKLLEKIEIKPQNHFSSMIDNCILKHETKVFNKEYESMLNHSYMIEKLKNII